MNIRHLPLELQKEILADAPHTLLACRFFNTIASDDCLWQQFYRRDFGPVPYLDIILDDSIKYKNNAKEMYIAAWMFREAEQAPLHVAPILFAEFAEFITLHPAQHLGYYRGLMRFYGKGVPKDEEQGLGTLINCTMSGDYRITLAILDVLRHAIHAKTYFRCTGLLTDTEKNNLFIRINELSAYHTKIKKLNPDLPSLTALCHQHGIGTEKNIEIAANILQKAIAPNNLKALYDLMELTNTYETLQSSTTSHLLELLKANTCTDRIRSELDYQLSHLIPAPQNRQHLESAVAQNHPEAAYHLYRIKLDEDRPIEAESLLLNKVIYNPQPSSIQPPQALAIGALEFFNLVKKNNILNARINPSTEINLNQIATDIWFLQLQLQLKKYTPIEGSQPFAFKILLNHATLQENGEANAMANCAVGTLLLWGILQTHENRKDNLAQANKHFASALNHDAEAINKYLKAGVDLGLISVRIARLMNHKIQKHMTSAPSNNHTYRPN